MGGKRKEICLKELRINYCIKNNGGVKKKLNLSPATLVSDKQDKIEFIRGLRNQVYDVQNMKILSILYRK
jgi:hypothetical protein